MSRPDPIAQANALATRATRPVEWAGAAIATVALGLVGLRSALRLELRWDTFAYHLPFAASRAGMGVPFEMEPYLKACYQGFPPLPELLQGLLWRVTGSVNATGVVNYLALLLFFYFAWRHLAARLWVLVLLSLSAPMVLIHAASSYVDLLSNALLAIGVTGFLAMLLFDRWSERRLLAWSLAGTIAAAWCKIATMPMVLLLLIAWTAIYAVRAVRGPSVDTTRDDTTRMLLRWVLLAFFIALLPYLKNAVVYHNPAWPGGIAAWSSHMPTMRDESFTHDQQTPPPLLGASRTSLFFHSLFEIDHPTSYPARERWLIDQGNAYIAFRSGGFWVVSVWTGTLAAVVLAFLSSPRRGLIVAAIIPSLWLLISVLPQSHELRYFQFLPLTLAALVAMLAPRVRGLYPLTTMVILCLVLGEFIFIAKVNRNYFRVERVGWEQAAEVWGVRQYWDTLERGKTYCAVGLHPQEILLTGPTLHEFRIVSRESPAECPVGTTLLQR